MKVKVCGITNIEQAQALDAMGVHYIGFIFYPSSK
ncbi:MAG: N-(5phosphoribosyl)anthranilate isomerase, partial [Bacteroidota bacterium]